MGKEKEVEMEAGGDEEGLGGEGRRASRRESRK